MLPLELLFLAGTRPEVLKLAPIVVACRARPRRFRVRFGLVHQQRALLDRALEDCGLSADVHVPLRTPAGPDYLALAEAEVRSRVRRTVARLRPDWVVVQGDTLTALAAALGARDAEVACAHVEAGLRTGDLADPFPEEHNRREIARVASAHYAPTERARENLLREGVSAEDIALVGNTGVDALRQVLGSLNGRARERWDGAARRTRRLLVTGHRRENHGAGMQRVCEALLAVLERAPDVHVDFVLHPHPGAYAIPARVLASHPRVTLHRPMHHVAFLDLMRASALVLSDSGGVQEELPYLGRPLLVLRRKTERPESIEHGVARLVGTDVRAIVDASLEVLHDDRVRSRMSRVTRPFGDGYAAQRIRDDLARRSAGVIPADGAAVRTVAPTEAARS